MKIQLIGVSIISLILCVNANVPNVRLSSGYDMPIVGFGSAKVAKNIVKFLNLQFKKL